MATFWIPALSARLGEMQGRKAPDTGPCHFRSRISKPQQRGPARQPSQGPGPSSALPAQTPNPLSWAASSLARTQAGDSQWKEEDGGSGVWGRPRRTGPPCCQPQHTAPKRLFLYHLCARPWASEGRLGCCAASGACVGGCALTLGDEDARPLSLVTGPPGAAAPDSVWEAAGPTARGRLPELSPAHGAPPGHQLCPQWLLRNWL